jgi:hypothetical protein
LYSTEQIVNTETVDSDSDVYLQVGLWRKEKNQTVCYRHIRIVDPYIFTKHARTERNLINRETDYLIPDKLLAVGPNNEVFYF